MDSSEFIKHYAEFYGDPATQAWRDLGALDKAADVMRLWNSREKSPAIVDIGCGDGAVLHELSRHRFGAAYSGFEVSPSGVECARRRDYGMKASIELFDGNRLPALDQSFDLAILSHVLEHVEAPRLLLREAARIARWVFVEVPLEFHWRTPRNYSWTDLGHINLFDMTLIRHLVQSAGLEVVDEEVTCPSKGVMIHNRPGLWHLFRWAAMDNLIRIVPALAMRLWTFHGCLLARAASRQTTGEDSRD